MATTLAETIKSSNSITTPESTASDGKRMVAIKLTYWLGIGADVLRPVANHDLSFGMMRMFEMLSIDLPQRIEVFRELSKGEKWLINDE